MPLQLVLDKSLLRSLSKAELGELCSEHTVLFTDTLFYELVDNAEDRKQCFAKLPSGSNVFSFLPCIGSLMRFEQEKRVPASPLIDHRLPGRLAFNRRLGSKNYNLYQIDATLHEHRIRTEDEVEGLVGLAGSIDKLWPDLRSNPQIPARRKSDLADRPEIIRQLYKKITDDHTLAAVIGANWVIFRWLQVRAIYCIDLGVSYMYDLSHASRIKLEHHLHDMNYVVYAALTGAIATADKRASEVFRLVRPDGVVIDQL